MSRARLERSGRAESRNGRPKALALFEHERTLLLRALHELVEREGPSRTTADLETMLERAAPRRLTCCASSTLRCYSTRAKAERGMLNADRRQLTTEQPPRAVGASSSVRKTSIASGPPASTNA